jgi:hypothetical protein
MIFFIKKGGYMSLKIIKILGNKKTKKGYVSRFALMECSYCGGIKELDMSYFRKCKSCGCARKKLISQNGAKHGDSRRQKIQRLYTIWLNMNRRCADKREKNYGGKGVEVCREWKEYLVFKQWALEHGYSYNLTIDRIDSDKGYYPENCQWLTLSENSSKGSRKRKLSGYQAIQIRELYNQIDITHHRLAQEYKVSATTIGEILRNKIYKNVGVNDYA